MDETFRAFRTRLAAPIDIASLVFFRIGFGAIMVWEAWRFLTGGKVDRYFIEPTFYFKYLGFAWVEPWPGHWMYLHFYLLGALGLCIALGLFYRLSAILFALGYTYVFLLDQAQYQNHYYLSPSWPRRICNWPHSGDVAPSFPLLPRPALLALAAYLAIQIFLPLRHWLYPGNPSWTEEGHRFAWHMKLRDKDCKASFVLEGLGVRWDVEPLNHLSHR